MRDIHSLVIWEVRRRISLLAEFRELASAYDKGTFMAIDRGLEIVENKVARDARGKLNDIYCVAREAILEAGLTPDISYMNQLANVQGDIDLISNMYLLKGFSDEMPSLLVDLIEKATGKYKREVVSAWIRTLNPLWWLFRLFSFIFSIPVLLLASAGYDAAQQDKNPAFRGIRLIWAFIIAVLTLAAVVLKLIEGLSHFPAFQKLVESTGFTR